MIRKIYLLTTNTCNLACRYCYQLKATNNTRKETDLFLSSQTVDNLLESIISGRFPASKDLEIFFFGGEATLNKPAILHVWEGAGRLREAGFKPVFTIQTNLYSNGLFEAMDSGVRFKSVTVSLDGPKDIHDRNRITVGGSGTYDKIDSNLSRLVILKKANQLETLSVEVTVTASSGSLVEIAKFLESKGIDHMVFVPEMSLMSISDDTLKERWLEMVDYVISRMKSPTPIFEGSTLTRILAVIRPMDRRTCGAGNRCVSVTPGGEIYPCGSLTNVSAFKQGDLSTMPDAMECDVAKALNSRKQDVDEVCRRCNYNTRCSQGCFANNYYRCSDKFVFHNPFCKIEMATIDLIEKRVEGFNQAEHKWFVRNVKSTLSLRAKDQSASDTVPIRSQGPNPSTIRMAR